MWQVRTRDVVQRLRAIDGVSVPVDCARVIERLLDPDPSARVTWCGDAEALHVPWMRVVDDCRMGVGRRNVV